MAPWWLACDALGGEVRGSGAGGGVAWTDGLSALAVTAIVVTAMRGLRSSSLVSFCSLFLFLPAGMSFPGAGRSPLPLWGAGVSVGGPYGSNGISAMVVVVGLAIVINIGIGCGGFSCA